MKQKLVYLLLAVALCLQGVYGQEKKAGYIKMRSEVSSDKVLLRWASTDAKAWQLLNKYGVRLERHVIVRDGEVLDEPAITILADCLKPEPSDAFKQVAQKYPYGAIIAQAVFGERFEVSGSGEYDVATVIALGQELQQRYVFSLYAADLCFPAAVAAGWGWEDTNVHDNERYLYKVIPLVPEKEGKIEEGGLFVDMGRKSRFPKALDFRATFSDSHALLRWNFRTMESIYNAYMPERSTDGIHFSPISETPITQMESAADKGNAEIMYIDSICNDTTYYYRIAGITPFGSKGAYSDTISGMGHRELSDPPLITKAIPDSIGGAFIEWMFDAAHENLIDGFVLERSDDDKDNYEELITGIGKTERAIRVPDIHSSNYFVVAARTLTGKKLRSFSMLVQKIDTIPPAVPVGLTAVADSTGHIHLSWQPNSDADIYGYRIYRGQTAEDELIPLNDVAVREAAFVDSVGVSSLNTKVYYAVSALDERYNQSAHCAVVEVRKVELIPPTAPFIREVKVTNGKNIIRWASGQEENLAGYEVYRQTSEDSIPQLLAFVEGREIYVYEDNRIENNKKYTYRVKSRTEGGLASDFSLDYRVTGIHKAEAGKVKANLTLTPVKNKVKLHWKVGATDVVGVQLYKKTKDGAFALLIDQMKPEGEWMDGAVSPGIGYQYMLVVKTNGSTPTVITKDFAL